MPWRPLGSPQDPESPIPPFQPEQLCFHESTLLVRFLSKVTLEDKTLLLKKKEKEKENLKAIIE